MRLIKWFRLFMLQVQLEDAIATGNTERARQVAFDEVRLRAELMPL